MKLPLIIEEFGEFWVFFWGFAMSRGHKIYEWFEHYKDHVVDMLYKQRGKYARPVVHTGMVGFLFLGVTIGPALLESGEDALSETQLPRSSVLGISTEDVYALGTHTLSGEGVLEYRGGEVVEYEVQDGETLSQIAEKFSLNLETIIWANGLSETNAKIKAGQLLKILPTDGVLHKVKKGETVYSVAKRYEANPQALVDYPFNSFTNDETFALAVGQTLMIPDGVMPKPVNEVPRTTLAAVQTPDAGAVSATGRFVWPAAGRITQGYRWYHKAIDIANKGGGPILAADSGQVTVAGWPDNGGYGNRVEINHGNGYSTLYAHLSTISVVPGQSVNRGDVLGNMGTTGRSTGVHLHFEIRAGGVLQNPLNFMQ